LADALLAAKAARVIAEQEAVWEAERIVEQASEEAEGVYTSLLNMDADEYALLELAADLMKLERYFHGRSRGVSFRIVRGVSFRMGEMNRPQGAR
jgi:hypothetical protein